MDTSGILRSKDCARTSGPALFISGYLNAVGEPSFHWIGRWNGSTWSPLAEGLDSIAEALCVFDDGSGPALYAGGTFHQAGGAPPELFSSHPNPGNRQEAIAKQIADWPPTTYVDNSQSFTQTKQHASKVKLYTGQEIEAGAKSGQWASMNAKNGAGLNSAGMSAFPTRGSASASLPVSAVSLRNILPSDHMVSANLGPVKIQHPENWAVTLPEQKGQFVTIAPAEGLAGGGVGYGVLLNGAAGPRGQQVSIDDMTMALIKQIQESNELELVSKPEPLTVGGRQGRGTFLRSPSPFPDAQGQPQVERDWLVTVPQSDGSMIFMIFVAPEPDFNHLKPTFEAMVKSVQLR